MRNQTTPSDPLLTFTAVGEMFGVSRTTVRKWIDHGKLASVPMPGSRWNRVQLSEVKRFDERLKAGEHE